MPSKSANVKNEKQYEKLGLPQQLQPGRHDRPEEGCRPQGRPQELLAT